MSLIYFAPTIIEMAGLPQSNHINYMLNLRNTLPVLTYSSVFYNHNGEANKYESPGKYNNLIEDYFSIEYYNINYPKNYADFYINKK